MAPVAHKRSSLPKRKVWKPILDARKQHVRLRPGIVDRHPRRPLIGAEVAILGTGSAKSYVMFLRSQANRKATMASGWAPDGAVQDQIDDTVMDGVMRARASMPTGKGETLCLECGDEIPETRRQVLPGVRTCIRCQSERDRRPVNIGFNRRGSKDSQLK
jgi:phage/conjugal plasmid C-4 type zinc finger TraR family protein